MCWAAPPLQRADGAASGHSDAWGRLGSRLEGRFVVRVVRVTPSRPFGSALGVAGARIWLKQKAHCHCVRRRWLPPYRPRRPGLAGQSTRLRRGKTAPGGLVAAAGVGQRAGGGGGGRRRTGFPPCSTRGRAGSGIRARPRRLGAATCVRGRFLADMQSIPNMQNKQQNTKYAINIPNMQKHTI